MKQRLQDRAPKTVNNVLSVLNTLLKTAVEWDAIVEMPCTVGHLKVLRREMRFHDFDEYERLVDAAKVLDAGTHLVVLLGGYPG